MGWKGGVVVDDEEERERAGGGREIYHLFSRLVGKLVVAVMA